MKLTIVIKLFNFILHSPSGSKLDFFVAFAEDESLPYIPNGNVNDTDMLECIPDWVAEVANDMDVCVNETLKKPC